MDNNVQHFVKKIRRMLNYSAYDFAKVCRFCPRGYRCTEDGERNFTKNMLVRIAYTLGTDLDTFRGAMENDFPQSLNPTIDDTDLLIEILLFCAIKKNGLPINIIEKLLYSLDMFYFKEKQSFLMGLTYLKSTEKPLVPLLKIAMDSLIKEKWGKIYESTLYAERCYNRTTVNNGVANFVERYLDKPYWNYNYRHVPIFHQIRYH